MHKHVGLLVSLPTALVNQLVASERQKGEASQPQVEKDVVEVLPVAANDDEDLHMKVVHRLALEDCTLQRLTMFSDIAQAGYVTSRKSMDVKDVLKAFMAKETRYWMYYRPDKAYKLTTDGFLDRVFANSWPEWTADERSVAADRAKARLAASTGIGTKKKAALAKKFGSQWDDGLGGSKLEPHRGSGFLSVASSISVEAGGARVVAFPMGRDPAGGSAGGPVNAPIILRFPALAGPSGEPNADGDGGEPGTAHPPTVCKARRRLFCSLPPRPGHPPQHSVVPIVGQLASAPADAPADLYGDGGEPGTAHPPTVCKAHAVPADGMLFCSLPPRPGHPPQHSVMPIVGQLAPAPVAEAPATSAAAAAAAAAPSPPPASPADTDDFAFDTDDLATPPAVAAVPPPGAAAAGPRPPRGATPPPAPKPAEPSSKRKRADAEAPAAKKGKPAPTEFIPALATTYLKPQLLTYATQRGLALSVAKLKTKAQLIAYLSNSNNNNNSSSSGGAPAAAADAAAAPPAAAAAAAEKQQPRVKRERDQSIADVLATYDWGASAAACDREQYLALRDGYERIRSEVFLPDREKIALFIDDCEAAKLSLLQADPAQAADLQSWYATNAPLAAGKLEEHVSLGRKLQHMHRKLTFLCRKLACA
ncbi:hypothetical protein DIPPA_15580 [Diplonema papillatum]|nr:hypothetical protein DIPPA_15580 [Diplonema papillatum]